MCLTCMRSFLVGGVNVYMSNFWSEICILRAGCVNLLLCLSFVLRSNQIEKMVSLDDRM